MIRHMFAGANTPKGFFSCFDYIMPVEKAKKRIFLKGSSGSGKSTIIKKISKEFECNGFDVDNFHCSNDVNSLDGISVNKKGICIIDGTSPHICDPVLPGAVDSIIDLAEFIDESKVSPFLDEIKSIVSRKKRIINSAYSYFAAAKKIHSINEEFYKSARITPKLHKLIRENMTLLNGIEESGNMGVNRKMFLSGVTPDGIKSFTDTVLQDYKVYGLYGETGMGAEELLLALQKEVNACGADTESFYCPLDPARHEHLLIPAIKLAFTTINGNHECTTNIDYKINFVNCADNDKITGFKGECEYNDRFFYELVKKSTDMLKSARQLHDRIEEIYMGSIDFEKTDEMTEQLIADLSKF